jgi:hypothetical protein
LQGPRCSGPENRSEDGNPEERKGAEPESGSRGGGIDGGGGDSEYAQPGYNGTGQTFLRGIQTSDASGRVTFTTVYPGWYAGRATHIHVKVYVGGAVVKTTQIAFPESTTAEVYASGVYASKGQSPTKNASDNVFSDGTQTEMASVTGSASAGYEAARSIGISA